MPGVDAVLDDMCNIGTEKSTIGEFLLRRLKAAGCDEIFGVPGDFVLGFFDQILKSDVRYIGTCNELNAAYAADGYARIKGIGCVATTSNVGELSALNGVAGSFAESVPVVVITGVPATRFYRHQPLLHHSLGDYDAAAKIYQHVTVAQTFLNNPTTAAAEIDRVLRTCIVEKLPVYLAIPSDMVHEEIEVPRGPFVLPRPPLSDPGALDEAILETLRLLHQSRQPLFIPGIEVERGGLQGLFEKLLSASGVPFATMMLSKGVLNEEHPQFIGLYSGDRSRPYVRERVENSDCLIIFGEKLTDFNTGGFSAFLDRRSTIEVCRDRVLILFHVYNKVFISDFIRELTYRINFRVPKHMNLKPATEGCVHRRTLEFIPERERKLTMSRLFDKIAHYLEPEAILIADTGASLFAAAEVMLPHHAKFIGQVFYGSIGYSIGASLGVCIAAPTRKVHVFVGDGSFQVTCQDVSTLLRYRCNPNVYLINNDGYTIERVIIDRPFNDIQPWKYHRILEVFNGGGQSFDVVDEGGFDDALADAKKNPELSFIECHLDRWDCNQALLRAGAAMALNNRLLDGSEAQRAREDAVRHLWRPSSPETSEAQAAHSADVVYHAPS